MGTIEVLFSLADGYVGAWLTWDIIRAVLCWQAKANDKAQMDAYLSAQYPPTMTYDECEEMQRVRWNWED
jgi:hypothetical protein